ncbi:MAG: Fur family transcriptional regulator [Hyphomicrobiales bacterium]|jgi:Fur family ferric uptake transcriptional regulator|nr:Fur family transcriptional regulator [Hyphomicrobiales bacterium]
MITPAQRYERFLTELKAAGVRLTEQRKVIVKVLAEARDHPNADELYHRAYVLDGSVSLSTVYRTLRLLEDHGAIQRHDFDAGRARFENADSDHHDHLIDIDTGQVIEFRSERIEKLQAEIAAELGFDIVRHKLELYGRRRG